MRVCLFEDQGAQDLEPLTLTRPSFDLLCGLDSLGNKQCRYFAPTAIGTLVRPHLAAFYRCQNPDTPTNDLGWLRAAPTILINGRWLPPDGLAGEVDGPCIGLAGNEVAYAVVGIEQLSSCSPNSLLACLETWKNTLPQRLAGGRFVRYLWDLIEWNPEQLRRDFERLAHLRPANKMRAKLALVGPVAQFHAEATAQIDPMVLADTTRGPVIIDREAVVTAFSRLEGPCYIGPGAHVLGAKIRAGTTLGPQCRVGGEVEATIMQGYCNKYHDGFLGHSYVGEWVNFGAGTQNSDLHNDYGEVHVPIGGKPVATRLTKVGCFIGDHTKTGIGTLFNTGTSVGVFCNLLSAGRLLPKYFPSFMNWWNGAMVDNAGLPPMLKTAAEAMRRRGCDFTEAHTALIRLLYDETAAQRHLILSGLDQPKLRRSA